MRQEDRPAANGTVAVVFAGQGSQRPGMGEAWRDRSSWSLWGEAEEILRRPLEWLALEAGEDELRQPVNCQTALFVHQAVLYQEWARGSGQEVACVAGHSLGEYNALVAAGVLTFAEALRLVDARAAATAEAAALAPGGMAACVGFDDTVVTRAATATGTHVCNDNAPGQLVVAGDHAALDRLAAALADGPGRVVRLNVGAAYHSPAMGPAVPRLREALRAVSFREPRMPVIANVDAAPHTRAGDWPMLLERQLIHAVRWRETVTRFPLLGVTTQVELSASPVLTALAKRAAPSLARVHVSTPRALEVAA